MGDLDHTLVSTDCTDEWIKVMYQLGLVDNPKTYAKQKELYNQAYRDGKCDMLEIQKFVLKPMMSRKLDTLNKDFISFARHIETNFLYPEARDRIKFHQH